MEGYYLRLKYATRARLGRSDAKLLFIENQSISHHTLANIAKIIPKNSVLVVNDAATIPASLRGKVGSLEVEVRLVRNLDHTYKSVRKWQVLIFSEGDWRMRTEDRMNPDFLEPGDEIAINGLQATVLSIDHETNRLATIEFCGSTNQIWNGVYRNGKPIQYSHLNDQLDLWDVQTIFATSPVAVEPPSAAFQFSWEIVRDIAAKGVEILSLTHATSISSTGIVELDQKLPFEEGYWIPQRTAEALNNAIRQGTEIIALGTSVTRALEDNVRINGEITAGEFTTNLVIDRNHVRKVVDALITGMHSSDESHFRLLENFVKGEILDVAYSESEEIGYLWHEYGDISLIVKPVART